MGEIWLKQGILETARDFRNNSSCGVENKLKVIKLTARKIEEERVTVVDLGMIERGGDCLSSGIPRVLRI